MVSKGLQPMLGQGDDISAEHYMRSQSALRTPQNTPFLYRMDGGLYMWHITDTLEAAVESMTAHDAGQQLTRTG